MSETKLEPCLFCGQPGKAEGPDSSIAAEIYYVGCRQGCIHFRGPLEWATKQWNRRSSHPGWHEAIDPQALTAAKRIVEASDPYEAIDNMPGEEIEAMARALLPPAKDAKEQD